MMFAAPSPVCAGDATHKQLDTGKEQKETVAQGESIMDSTKIDRVHQMYYLIRRGYCAMQRGHIAIIAGMILLILAGCQAPALDERGHAASQRRYRPIL